MKLARTLAELEAELGPERRAGRSIGLAPTMGALHAGHRALIEQACRENDFVVVSLFVNPMQFGQDEDFGAYPREEGSDRRLAEQAGCDLLFAPAREEIYPAGFSTTVRVAGLSEVLCGGPEARGPEHFTGVTTVVCKLLNAVRPDRAYFGQKDAQQLIVIRRMARDLDMPVEIRGVPTVRDPDGLAISSRNAYLTEAERRQAAAVPRALREAAAIAAETGDVAAALARGRTVLDEAGIEPEYLEARNTGDLSLAPELGDEPVLIAIAARVGRARLIDNFPVVPSSEEVQHDE